MEKIKSGAPGSLRQPKILSVYFLTLCTISVCVTLVTYMSNTIMADYAMVELGAAVGIAGIISGMTNIGSLAITFFTGPLNNNLDKRRVNQAAALMFLIATIGFSTVRTVPLLLVFRFVAGLGTGLNAVSIMVMVTEVVPEDRITESVGYYGLAGMISQAVGPAISIWISQSFGHKGSFMCGTVMALTAFLIGFKLPESRPAPVLKEQKGKKTFKEFAGEIVCKESWLPAVVGALFALINGIQQAFIVPYAKALGISSQYSGLYFTASATCMWLARIFLGKFIQKRTVAFAVAFSGVFLTLCPLALGLGGSAVTMVGGGALFGIGYGTLLPVTQSLGVKLAPEGKKGSGSSTYFMGIYTAFALGPTVGGFIAGTFGYQRMFLLLTATSLLSIGIGVWKGRFPINPEHQAKPAETAKALETEKAVEIEGAAQAGEPEKAEDETVQAGS